MNKQTSEFGEGLTYNLGMFLAHENLHTEMFLGPDKEKLSKLGVELWFNASSDHLYGLQIPKKFPVSLQSRLLRFKRKCLEWGHGFPEKHATIYDYYWAMKEARVLLVAIDKYLGISVRRGEYE